LQGFSPPSAAAAAAPEDTNNLLSPLSAGSDITDLHPENGDTSGFIVTDDPDMEVQMRETILRQGYILKRSTNILHTSKSERSSSASNWKRRYLVLMQNGDLFYYNTEEEYLSGEYSKLYINIPEQVRIRKGKLKIRQTDRRRVTISYKLKSVELECLSDKDTDDLLDILEVYTTL
jgi:hypothetical protein